MSRAVRTIFIPTVAAALGSVVFAQFSNWPDERKEQFLRDGEVVRTRTLSEGVTHSRRLTLRDGDLTHDAHFQTVDIHKPFKRTTGGLELQFADSYKYNIAAYRLDRLLGMRMVPVSVERRIRGETGALTWWVDDVLVSEKDRYRKKISPPDVEGWNRQIRRARVFNELVYNTDANLGNLLITKSWQLKLIDFTRAFRPFSQLRAPKNLTTIDREFFDALRRLDPARLHTRLHDVLAKSEIKAILARRDRIVARFEKLSRQQGGSGVIY